MTLEPQHAITQNSRFGQRRADLAGDRAQILADDDEPAALAFERQNAQQILRIVADISAVGGWHAVGDPAQAEESHDVIDAQRPAVPGLLADRFARTTHSRRRGALRDWEEETPSPGRAARNRRAALPRGTRWRKTGDWPTDPRPNGRWRAPDRDTGRSRMPRSIACACASASWRSMCHCRNL